MEDWNQVHATVSIDGENRNYTHISLVQKFGQHHYFDIEVLCSPLVKENVWHHEREEMIDEIMMRDGVVAASDYEDGFEEGREDSWEW